MDRRSYLKATATGAVSVTAVGSGVAAGASTEGYGAGGYGEGAYGGSTESVFTVSTDSPATVGETSLELAGTLSALGGASSADCGFQYRRSGSSTWQSATAGTLSATGQFTTTVSGLRDGAAYEYRAVGSASDGDTDTGTTRSVTTTEHLVAVSTAAPAAVGTTEATLAGSLDDLGNAASAECSFEYRETGATSWQSTPAQSLNATGGFEATVSGLASDTEYEYRAVASATDGDAATGGTAQFTTKETRLAVAADAVTDRTETSATLAGSLNDLGDAASVDCSFEYRETGATGWQSTAATTLTGTGQFELTVTALSPATEYEWRARADASDGDTAFSDLATVTTLEPALAVSTDGASDVRETEATLAGTLDDAGGADTVECAVEYRRVGASNWTRTDATTRSEPGSFTRTVSGLDAGTDYEFRAVASASDGDAATGTVRTVTTTEASAAPTIDRFAVAEAGSPNPHAEISVDWAVSHATGDLATVAVTVADAGSGRIVKSSTSSVSGTDATGADSFKVKHARGGVFDVTLTVTDTGTGSASATETVTE